VRQAQLEQNLAPDTFDPCANSEYPGLAASKLLRGGAPNQFWYTRCKEMHSEKKKKKDPVDFFIVRKMHSET
jgi:hypothetical protein